MSVHDLTEHLLLEGLDGSNPLAFLAALGTLRSLTAIWPERGVRLSWTMKGTWRPALRADPPACGDEIVRSLDTFLRARGDHPVWSLGPDLNVAADRFKEYAERAAAQARGDRSWADFAAAFGCEATLNESGTIQDTALRTMSGAGHQHFLGFMVNIIQRTTAEHLVKALFQPWRYDDPLDTQTLRWDPADDVRRALRWRDPSGDPQRRKRGGMLGANRLAIEGLPLLPTVPVGGLLRTTGFKRREGGRTYWNWPIWTGPLTLDVVRSLLALPEILDSDALDRLQRRGVVQVMRTQRLTVGKFRCFTPGQPI
jgi:hypothetical protein